MGYIVNTGARCNSDLVNIVKRLRESEVELEECILLLDRLSVELSLVDCDYINWTEESLSDLPEEARTLLLRYCNRLRLLSAKCIGLRLRHDAYVMSLDDIESQSNISLSLKYCLLGGVVLSVILLGIVFSKVPVIPL